MQLESMYQEIILDHYRHPHNKGLREPFDAQAHHVNPTCGDEITLRVAVKDAGGEPEVADVSYDALGCSISQASTSMLTDMVVGKTVAEAMDGTQQIGVLAQRLAQARVCGRGIGGPVPLSRRSRGARSSRPHVSARHSC